MLIIFYKRLLSWLMYIIDRQITLLSWTAICTRMSLEGVVFIVMFGYWQLVFVYSVAGFVVHKDFSFFIRWKRINCCVSGIMKVVNKVQWQSYFAFESGFELTDQLFILDFFLVRRLISASLSTNSTTANSTKLRKIKKTHTKKYKSIA